MKRAPKYMTKPTGRVPKQIGALMLKEGPYKDGWIVDITWRGADTPSGRGHKQKNNWRHAEEFAAKENKRLDELKEKGAGRFTGNDAMDSFLKEREALSKAKDNTGCTLDTFAFIQHTVEKHLRPKFGHMRLTEIKSHPNIRNWIIEQAETAKPHTIRNRKGVLNLVLNHAVDHDMLPVNPLKVKKVKVPGKFSKRAKIPDRSDLEVLREYLNGPRPLGHGIFAWSCTRMVVLLAVSCGLRAGEASALQWDDIDRDNGEININRNRGPRQGMKGPKSEAGNRKIPTTLAARAIINNHAEVYKQKYGKCVGPVLRSSRKDYLSSARVSGLFKEAMRACGLVEPGTNKIKFSHHKGRHWTASHWMKSTGDIHQTTKWMGHQNASMTLDIYGRCLDDPEARAKFERMPDWLIAPIETDSLSAPQPVEITAPLRALPAPEDSFEFGQVNGPAEPGCPIDIPDFAEPWVKPFIAMLAQAMPIEEAYCEIAPQVPNLRSTKNRAPLTVYRAKGRVLEEFKRLKLPTPATMAARLLAEKILKLHGQKYQALDIARRVGCSSGHVERVLRDRHKPNANNPLNRKLKSNWPNARKTQPEHKIQLKLL